MFLIHISGSVSLQKPIPRTKFIKKKYLIKIPYNQNPRNKKPKKNPEIPIPETQFPKFPDLRPHKPTTTKTRKP